MGEPDRDNSGYDGTVPGRLAPPGSFLSSPRRCFCHPLGTPHGQAVTLCKARDFQMCLWVITARVVAWEEWPQSTPWAGHVGQSQETEGGLCRSGTELRVGPGQPQGAKAVGSRQLWGSPRASGKDPPDPEQWRRGRVGRKTPQVPQDTHRMARRPRFSREANLSR